MQLHHLSLPALLLFAALAPAQPGIQARLNPGDFPEATAYMAALPDDCNACSGGDVIVDQDSTVDFSTPKPSFSGDPDLAPFFSADQSGDTPETWTARFDLGGRRLVLTQGTTLTVQTLPSGNGQASPGLDLRTTCAAVIDGTVRLRGADGHTGDLNLFAGGGITVNGAVVNEIVGTWGISGNLTLAAGCGELRVNPTGLVLVKGSQLGGRDLNLLTYRTGAHLNIAGRVEAVFDYNLSPKLNLAAFGGDINVDGTTLLGWEYGRRLSSGVRLRSTAGSTPESLTMVAHGNIQITGHGAFDLSGDSSTFTLDQPLRDGESVVQAAVTLTDLGADQVRVDIQVPGGNGALKGVFGNLFDETLIAGLSASGDDLNDHRFLIVNGSDGLPGYWMAPPGGWDFALGLGPEDGALTSATFTLTAPGLSRMQLLAAQADGWTLGLLMTPLNGARGGRSQNLNNGLLRVGMRSPLFLPAFQDGAVAVKNKGEIAAGGRLSLQALNGEIRASQWAVDNANGGVGGETVLLEAKGDIRLEAGDVNLAQLQGGVKVVSGEGRSQGVENTLRSHSGGVHISAGAVVSSDSPARLPGSNRLIACTGVFNQGIVVPQDLDTGDDSGTCPLSVAIATPTADALVNSPTVTVTGTVSHADATVTVNGVSAALTDLNWTAEVPLPVEGTNPINAVAERNGEQAQDSRNVIRDTTAPAITLNAPDTIQPGGKLGFDWTVTDANPVTVTVTRDGEAVSEQPTGSDAYAVPADTQATAVVLNVTAVDAAGNNQNQQHTVAVVPLDLSMTIQAADDQSPLDGAWTNGLQQHYRLLVGADVVSIEVSATRGGQGTVLTPTAGEALWTADNLAEGGYTYQFTSVGPQNQRDSVTLNLNIDRTAPAVVFNPPAQSEPGATQAFSAEVTDEASGVAGFTATDGLNPNVSVSDGTSPAWTWTAPTQAGPWTLSLTAVDHAGNAFSQDFQIQIAVTPTGPFSLDWTMPLAGAVSADETLTVTGRITQGVAARVTVNGVDAVLNGADFSLQLPVAEEGLVWLNLLAVSTDGQNVQRRRPLTLDHTAPQITVNGGLNQRGAGQTLTLTGSVADTWDPVPVLRATGQPGQFTNRFQLTGLRSQDFPLELEAVDHVGNTRTVTVTWTPDPNAGVALTLEATPQTASAGSGFWLNARATARGDSPVTRVTVFEMLDGQSPRLATAQSDLVRHFYHMANRPQTTQLNFRAEAVTADGSRAETTVTVPVGGDLMIEGHVYHAETGHPLPNAQVTLMPQNQDIPVDENGYYRFWLVEPAEFITVNAAGFSGVRLQGPFLPGDIRLLPDARLTPLGAVIDANTTLTPAAVLAADANPNHLTQMPQPTTLDWSGGAATLTQFSNQALPLAAPMGWAPHTVFRLGLASGSGTWRGPPMARGVLVSFTSDRAAWRIEGLAHTAWTLPVFPDHHYALMVADEDPGPLTPGDDLTRLPQSLGAAALTLEPLTLETNPPLSIARPGVSSLAVIRYGSPNGWSGQRVEILRSESYRALNPTDGDNVENDLRQQAVLYRDDAGLGALLPLVPRREDLVPELRSALIGGPIQPVATQGGAWVDGQPHQSEVLPGMVLAASSETRFWIRAESVRSPQPLFPEWSDLGAFRFSLNTRGATPQINLAAGVPDAGQAGTTALFRREVNPLGASIRLMGITDESGAVVLLPGRQWIDGFYFVQRAPTPIVLGRVSLNPVSDGHIRLLNSPIGDVAPGYLPLQRGLSYIDGQALNGAFGQTRVQVSGEERDTLQISLSTAAPSLYLLDSIPANGDALTLAPQFSLSFNRGVDETTVGPNSLQVRVNGQTRQTLWRWEQGGDRAQGYLRHLIEDQNNDVLQPGDVLTLSGTAEIRSIGGLALEPFTITATVPVAATPLPLSVDNLYLTYDAATREAVIHMRGPVGPAGTIAEFMNEQTAASGSFVQVGDAATNTTRLGSALGDPIEVTLTAPNGAAVNGRLTLYFDGQPSEDRVAFTVGPAGGTFDLPGAGAFTLPEGAVDDIRTVSFTAWDQEEPDTNEAADVTTKVWIIRGLQDQRGVAPLTWTPDIQFDAEGKPLNSVQLNQNLNYTPEWLREQLAEMGEEIPERPMIELASPWIQESFQDIPVNFVADSLLGAPPEDSKRKAVLGWGWAAYLFERDIAMTVSSILTTGVEGRGTVKFGKVGAFSYKKQVIEGGDDLRAEEGELIGGAWVLGPVDHSPGNRQYPVQIALTAQDGSYWGSSVFWLPSNLQSLGLPTWASHPAFLSMAEKIYHRDAFESDIPNTILENFRPQQYFERHFGFWYVDPDGGIGNARPTGLGLELKDAEVRGQNGRKDATLSANFKNTGQAPAGYEICFRWSIIDDAGLEHSEIARLDGAPIDSDIITTDQGKVLEVCVPGPNVGVHRVRVVVRNQYGLEMYASYGFTVLPESGSAVIQPSAAEPFVLQSGVTPIPLETEVLGDVPTGVGEIGDHDLIAVPFSEPVTTGDPQTLGEQILIEVAELGVSSPQWKPWPVEFLHGQTLEVLTSNVELTRIYVRPLGVLPGGHVLRLRVLANGQIRDTGEASDEGPLALRADPNLEGDHYVAKWLTVGISGNVRDFTRNAVIDYASHGKWLFELSWTEAGNQQLVVYKTSGSGELSRERVIPLVETQAQIFAMMNRTARTIAFWPNPKAADGNPAAVPGYVLIGCKSHQQQYAGGQAQTLRPARVKIYNVNREPEYQLVGGMAFSDDASESVRHMSVHDNLMLATTVWGGVMVVDLQAVIEYYQEKGLDDPAFRPKGEKPLFNTVLGKNQPATAILERYFPLQYPAEFFIPFAIGSPFQMEAVLAPRIKEDRDTGETELGFFGTGGIEFGSWYHGTPPIEFLLSGFDASYRPFDASGEERYDTQAARLKNWDVDGDRVDDRRIYFSGQDEKLTGDAPFLGKGALPAKFSPVMIQVLHHVQTQEMSKPRDIMVLRSNPGEGGDVHGGLMFVSVEARNKVNYLAYLRFNSRVKNIKVNETLQQVTAVSDNGRLLVIDIPTWIDLGLRFQDDPENEDLAQLNQSISNPAEPIDQGDYLPGVLVDITVPHARYPLAFMDDRIVVGDEKEQKQIVLRPPLFINPGFYTDSDNGGRSRRLAVDVIPSAPGATDGQSKTKVKISFSLREDADVSLFMKTSAGDKRLWKSSGALVSGKGTNTHSIIFPLEKIDLVEADVAEARIPLILERKLYLFGEPVRDPSDTEDAKLFLALQTDPWGSGQTELGADLDVEPWSGRLAWRDGELPNGPNVGAQVSSFRQYSHHGFWSGSLGRGWFLPWEANLIWTVAGPERDQAAIQVTMPGGEVHQLTLEEGEWRHQTLRFKDGDHHTVEALLEDAANDRGGFPEDVTLSWGSDTYVFAYQRHWTSADFSSGDEDFIYAFNDDMDADATSTARTGRYMLKSWKRDTGAGNEGHGWEVEHDGARVSRVRATHGDYELSLSYRRHPGTGLRGLEKIAVEAGGHYQVEFRQDTDLEDYMALAWATSDLFPGKFEYDYQTRTLGVLPGADHRIESLVMTRHKDLFGAETMVTYADQDDQTSLPAGFSWPYVARLDRAQFADQTFAYTWRPTLPGRTNGVTLTETEGGQTETYTWTYGQVGEGRDFFATQYSRNGFDTHFDWGQWPGSKTIQRPNGVTEIYTFDDLMRVTGINRTSSSGPVNSITNIEYKGRTSLETEMTGSNGIVIKAEFDDLGRMTRFENGLGGNETYRYSGPESLTTSLTDETGTVTSYSYDVLGRTTRLQRLGYSERTEYRRNGRKTTVDGEAGLSYVDDTQYLINNDGYIQRVNLTSSAPATANTSIETQYDPWGRVRRVYRAGQAVYAASQFALAGPLRETLHWSHNGAVRTNTYGEPKAAGYVLTGVSIGGQATMEMTNDDFGYPTQTKNFVEGLLTQTTFNSLGDLTSLQQFNLDNGQAGSLLETLSIDYNNINHRLITRNGQTYSMVFSPGPTWHRLISGSFGQISMEGSGSFFESMEGTVEGKPVGRRITREPGKEIITQVQSPRQVTKTLSGDGRVYRIETGGGTVNQSFNGYGMVLRTWAGPATFYEMNASNGHFQRTRWSTAGQTYTTGYQGALVKRNGKNDRTIMEITGWDTFGRATAYTSGDDTITVTYDNAQRTRRILRQKQDAPDGVEVITRMDGLGRMVHRSVAEVVPGTPAEWERVNYSFQYGSGLGEGRTAPGDRLIHFEGNRLAVDYFYHDNGRFAGMRKAPKDAGKRAPGDEVHFSVTYSQSTDENGNPVDVATSTGPDGGQTITVHDAAGRLLEKTREGLLLVANTYDDSGRLVETTDRQGRVTSFRYDGLDETPVAEITRAGEELHITLFEYDDQKHLIGKRDRVELDQDGNYINGVWWRYTYDAQDRLTLTERGLNGVDYQVWERITYDINASSPRDHRLTDVQGVTWTLRFDPLTDQLISRTNDGTEGAEGFDESWQELDNGNVIRYRRGDHYFVDQETDYLGRTVRRTVFDAELPQDRTFLQEWRYQYQSDLRTPAREEHPDGRIIVREFAEDGSVAFTRYTTADAPEDVLEVATTFDDLNRLESMSTSGGQRVDFAYDLTGRLVGETWNLAAFERPLTTSYTYDERGNQTGVLYPSGRRLSRNFNGAGRIGAVVEGGAVRSSYDYTIHGQLSRIEQAGAVAQYHYDPLGRLVRQELQTAGDLPVTRTETFGYAPTPGDDTPFCDDQGQASAGHPDDIRCHQITWGGVHLESYYSYDQLGRLREERTSNAAGIPGRTTGAVTWRYDALGNISQLETPYGLQQYTYNSDGSTASRTFNGFRTDFAYDDAGRVVGETEYNSANAPTGYSRSFRYDQRGFLSDIVENGPVQSMAQQFEYDVFGRLRATRNTALESNGWNVFTLSQPPIAGRSDLPIAMAVGPRTEEVLLPGDGSRGERVLGFGYGPQGLAHIANHPTNAWTQGAVTPHFTDPFQNTSAILETGAIRGPPADHADLAVANFFEPGGGGVVLDTADIVGGATQQADPLHQDWDINNSELARESEAAPEGAAPAWEHNLLHALVPGFTGNTNVGGLLTPPQDDQDGEPARISPSGMPATPLPPLEDMGTRLYHPGTQSFTAPDGWAQFDPARDVFSANRFLYANADPVNHGDLDGRLPSFKNAMDYVGIGGLNDLAFDNRMSNLNAYRARHEAVRSRRTALNASVVADFVAPDNPLGEVLFSAVVELGVSHLNQFNGGFEQYNQSIELFGAPVGTPMGMDLLLDAARLNNDLVLESAKSVLPGESSLPQFMHDLWEGVRGLYYGNKELLFEQRDLAAGQLLNLAPAGLDALTGGGDLSQGIGEDLTHGDHGMSVNSLFGQSLCFAEDTPVLTAVGNQPIQTVRVGHRVISLNADDDPDPATEIDAQHYRLLTLEMERQDGSGHLIHIQTLRPVAWLQLVDAAPGRWIQLTIDEMQVSGVARIVAVEPCPELQDGPGNLVLTTFRTLASGRLRFHLEGAEEPLEVTPNHLFYASDQSAWVPAGKLSEGDRLETINGTVTLTAIEHLDDLQSVYNIEVENDHNYYVTLQGLLSHNANPHIGKKLERNKQKFQTYLTELESQTDLKIKRKQHRLIRDAYENNDYVRLSTKGGKKHRKSFNREAAIKEWEKKTGQSWPTYDEDLLSKRTGKVIRKKGAYYDAHHIIENVYGGPHVWWNMHPARFPDQHQGGIHTTDAMKALFK